VNDAVNNSDISTVESRKHRQKHILNTLLQVIVDTCSLKFQRAKSIAQRKMWHI